MNENRGVSVIIPCYNDARYVLDALSSLHGQDSDLPFEAIIIDDGSINSHTYRDLAEAVHMFPNMDIQIFHHERNQGVSAARNTGLKHARYDYIFPLDVDNKLSTDPSLISSGRGYMDRAVGLLEHDPDIVMVHCIGEYFEGATGPCNIKPYDEKRILSMNVLDTRAMYRRKEALEVGGYQTMPFAEDWDFAVTMINERHKNGQCAEVVNIDDPVFLYRVRADASNLSASTYNKKAVLTRVFERSPELFRKHYPYIADKDMVDFLFTGDKRRKTFAKIMHEVGKLAKPSKWPKIPGRLKSEFGRCARSLKGRLPAGLSLQHKEGHSVDEPS